MGSRHQPCVGWYSTTEVSQTVFEMFASVFSTKRALYSRWGSEKVNTVSTATIWVKIPNCSWSLRYSLYFPCMTSLSIFEVKLSQGEDSHSSKGGFSVSIPEQVTAHCDWLNPYHWPQWANQHAWHNFLNVYLRRTLVWLKYGSEIERDGN